MYIHKTTATERFVIEEAVYEIFPQLDNALYIIFDVINEYFGDYEQKEIDSHDAERIGVFLRTAADIIFDSVLSYYLTVGDGRWRGVEPYLQSAQRAQAAIRTEKAISKVLEAERKVGSGSEKAADIIAQRKRFSQLPDEQAAPLLEALAKGER